MNPSHIRAAKAAGFVATALTALVTARFGWMQGEDTITCIVYAGGLALASFLVGYGLVFAWASHKAKLPVAITASCVFIFAISVAVEVLSHIGSAASARSHDIEQATQQTTTYTDTRAELDRARADLATIPPGRVPASISAELATLEARPWFAQTASCATPGSYANSCRRYQALKGELATAQRRAALDAKIEKLTTASATTTAGHSVVASQTKAIAAYANWTIKPSQDDQTRTNMAITLLLACYFVSMGLLNLVAHALDGIGTSPDGGNRANVVPFTPANTNAPHTIVVEKHDDSFRAFLAGVQNRMNEKAA